jgi:ESCRT-I complex subunit VPS28
LYASIKALDKLERAYTRGAFDLSPEAKARYESACTTLLAQCKTNHDYIKHVFPNVTQFTETYNMLCHRALTRLTRGVPATLEHGDSGLPAATSDRRPAKDATAVAEALIGLGDVLRLNQNHADDLRAYVEDALTALNVAQYLVPKLDGKEKLVTWAAKIRGMHAIEQLDDADMRQFAMDVENLYREFKIQLPT